MSDVLTVAFTRRDRHPNSRSYGEHTDQRLQNMTGRARSEDDTEPSRTPLPGFPATVEYHESGPVFLFEPDRLHEVEPIIDGLKALAAEWAERSTGHEPRDLSVRIRLGPESESVYQSPWEWSPISVTLDPAKLPILFGEVVGFVSEMAKI